MANRKWILMMVLSIAALIGCDEIDCTLYNTVFMRSTFYSDGSQISLTDTLTVGTGREARILLNRMTGASDLTLPLSHWQEVDTLVLTVSGENYLVEDTLWITKTNTPYFESPDCPTNVFHYITSVNSTHTFIDSVSILEPHVNYAQGENLRIHLYSAD